MAACTGTYIWVNWHKSLSSRISPTEVGSTKLIACVIKVEPSFCFPAGVHSKSFILTPFTFTAHTQHIHQTAPDAADRGFHSLLFM
ncbi:hypothetical protein ABVT39_011812 [Epinephelus coioides]